VLLAGCKTEKLPNVYANETLAMTTKQIERAGIYSVSYLEYGNYAKLKSDYDNNRLVFDPQTEKSLFESLYAVYNSRVDLSDSLNRFVRAYPKDVAPLLYRGSYLIGEGWRERGHDYANKTSSKQFSGLQHFHALAEKDLKKVLRIMPENYQAMILLADIYMSRKGSQYEMNYYFNKAKAIHPESYPLWYSILNASAPRWHGSIASMEKHINQMSNYLENNGRLKRLRNRVLLEEATDLYKARNYSDAKKVLLKALNFGGDATAFSKLGYAEEKLGNIEDACYYYNESVRLSPFTWLYNMNVAACAKYGYEHP
jgi:tetratricopeptide (TPR) repeat protein